MRKLFCMGIRLNNMYKEVTCEHREQCDIYLHTHLAEALSHPEEYEQADVYNNRPCKHYKDYGKRKKTIFDEED